MSRLFRVLTRAGWSRLRLWLWLAGVCVFSGVFRGICLRLCCCRLLLGNLCIVLRSLGFSFGLSFALLRCVLSGMLCCFCFRLRCLCVLLRYVCLMLRSLGKGLGGGMLTMSVSIALVAMLGSGLRTRDFVAYWLLVGFSMMLLCWRDHFAVCWTSVGIDVLLMRCLCFGGMMFCGTSVVLLVTLTFGLFVSMGFFAVSIEWLQMSVLCLLTAHTVGHYANSWMKRCFLRSCNSRHGTTLRPVDNIESIAIETFFGKGVRVGAELFGRDAQVGAQKGGEI